MVGLLDGYANQSQEGFLREAQTFNNPGAQVPPQQEAQPEQPQEQVATSITWSDAGGSPKEQELGPLPQQEVDPEAQSGTPSDTQVANTTAETVETQLAGKADKKIIKSASQWMGDSTGLADAIVKLDAGIEKQENRRDAMKLMIFGLGMLSGEGINASIQAANQVGSFNEKRINALYDQRKTIQDRVTKSALDQAIPGSTASAGSPDVFGDTYKGSDGRLYSKRKDGTYIDREGNPPSSDVTLTKTGAEGADLPASVLKSIDTLHTEAEDLEINSDKLNRVINDIDSFGGAEGIFGTVSEFTKNVFGWQGGTSEWKKRYQDFRNSSVIANLPPGVASDRDIAIAREGFPDQNWDKEQLKSWMRGYQKLTRYQATYKRAIADWKEKNRGRTAGFRKAWENSPEYLEWKEFNGIETGSAPESNSTNQTADFDFSDL